MACGVLAAASAGVASAGTIDPCDGNCTWSIGAGGVQVASGDFAVDPSTGEIDLSSPVHVGLGGGAWAAISGLSGNSDPVLGFNVSAATGANPRTFTFTFSLPTSLSGLIDTSSSVSYALTSNSTTGAQISPLSQHVVVAQDVDTAVNGLAPFNSGVDTGDRFFFTGTGTKGSQTFTADSTHIGNPAYDLMSVTLGFSLTPMSTVGVLGSVQETVVDQTPVPIPATFWLLGAGLFGWTCLARRGGRWGFGPSLINPT